MIEEALKLGADCVGGIPHFEWAREIGEKSVHRTVELAVKYGKLIDVHCDETDDVMSRFVELLNADRNSVVEGKRVSVRVDLGGRCFIQKKITTMITHAS